MKKSKALLTWTLALAMLGTNVHSVRASETTTDAADIVAEQTVDAPENADVQFSAGNVGDGSVSDGDLSASETDITAPEALVAEVPESIAEVVGVKQKADLNTHFEGTYKKFTVDNKKLAAVSAKGILTAKKPSTVVVTAYVKNGKIWEAAESVEVVIEQPVIAQKTITKTKPNATTTYPAQSRFLLHGFHPNRRWRPSILQQDKLLPWVRDRPRLPLCMERVSLLQSIPLQ